MTGCRTAKYTIPDAIGSKTFHPYSDFLLHDIGTGDGIVVAMQEHYGKRMYQTQWRDLSLEAYQATANRMRTAPLWGLRSRNKLLHDGRTTDRGAAILAHAGQGAAASAAYAALSLASQNDLLAYLNTL